MSTSKDLSALVARLEAKAIAKPTKAAIYEAKLDAKIAAIIAKGKTSYRRRDSYFVQP